MKIGLGTVQFGMNYGISNTQGQVSQEEINNILKLSQSLSIDILDTAIGYGDSESRIGTYNKSCNSDSFKIVTKIPPIKGNSNSINNLIDKSLKQLGTSQLYGVLLHDADDMTEELFHQLLELKRQHIVNKVGVSVYTPEQALNTVGNYNIDLIQVPLNIFDQRFINTGCLEFLKQKNIEVHARSIFLQGLLLMPLHKVSNYFEPHFQLLREYRRYCVETNLSALELSLSIINKVPDIDRFILGVCSHSQLSEICKSIKKTQCNSLNISQFNSEVETLINPSLWQIK